MKNVTRTVNTYGEEGVPDRVGAGRLVWYGCYIQVRGLYLNSIDMPYSLTLRREIGTAAEFA
jgi:hypothetical protein